MKRIKICCTLLMIMALCLLNGCNQTIIDTVHSYDYAYIEMPDGTVVEGKVDEWADYSDSDQLQIKINGVVYLTHSTRCVLVHH